MNPIKKKIKQLFCKHAYFPVVKVEKFHNLSGDHIYLLCEKCGKTEYYQFLKTGEPLYYNGKFYDLH